MDTMDDMTAPSVCGEFAVGNLLTLPDGHRYRITKKTTTAIAVARYYWFDALYDRFFKRKEEGPDVPHTP